MGRSLCPGGRGRPPCSGGCGAPPMSQGAPPVSGHSSRRCFGVLVFFLGGIFCIFLTCFYPYFWDCFDIKLIVNKRGAPEAPPTHYPINFISKQSQKYALKHVKNIQKIPSRINHHP